ncbi:MAG: FmdB family zinc ribbon protein, partial [Burkholderiales bacterium]
MPLYEYHCTKCDERFARTESMAEHGSGKRPACPRCSSRAVEP